MTATKTIIGAIDSFDGDCDKSVRSYGGKRHQPYVSVNL